jgi:hypothetical protein
VTVGIDLGKYVAHWVAVAWPASGAAGHVLDYDRLDVPSPDLGVERAVLATLRRLRDEVVLPGWPVAAEGAAPLVPCPVFVDAGYQTDVVYAFCRESGERFRPAVRRGADQQRRQWAGRRAAQTGSVVQLVGEGYHAAWLPLHQLHLLEVDSDHWKTWAHQRLATPVGSPGAMTLFDAPPHEHLALARHLTAETKVEEFVAGKGVVVRWERVRRQNHWLDALYNACAVGHLAGVRLVDERPEPAPPPPPTAPTPRCAVVEWTARPPARF